MPVLAIAVKATIAQIANNIMPHAPTPDYIFMLSWSIGDKLYMRPSSMSETMLSDMQDTLYLESRCSKQALRSRT
jgi:hypothetical protein